MEDSFMCLQPSEGLSFITRLGRHSSIHHTKKMRLIDAMWDDFCFMVMQEPRYQMFIHINWKKAYCKICPRKKHCKQMNGAHQYVDAISSGDIDFLKGEEMFILKPQSTRHL